MPCNSDYMDATSLELEISRVYCLLDEIATGKPVKTDSSDWHGYHPEVYTKVTHRQADAAVDKLCSKLRKVKDVSKYSLEMQVWWRDHQEADRKREAKEQKQARQQALAESAMQKISRGELAALKKWLLK